MDVLVTWLCLGGGVAMIVTAAVLIRRTQARTLDENIEPPQPPQPADDD